MADTTVDTLTGLIPVAVAGGMTMSFMDKAMSMGQQPTRDLSKFKPRMRTAKPKKSSKWNPLTRKEAIELIGSNKVDLLKKNPGKEYTWGYDTFVFEDGEYFLA
jgi:hypothetical protein